MTRRAVVKYVAAQKSYAKASAFAIDVKMGMGGEDEKEEGSERTINRLLYS